MAIYRNPRQDKDEFFSNMSRALDFYCRTYDRFMIVGDFNLEPERVGK